MTFKNNTRITSWFLCVMLIVAMAFTAMGCNTNTPAGNTQTTTVAEADANTTILGEGQTTFGFVVVDKDGNETRFEIHTDKETVGDALLELELISGEVGDYGLYVKTVNGITADYDVDQTYWAFYINGEYAMSGVDSTTIENDAVYSFKVEK